MEVSCIDSESGFRALAEDWNRLAASTDPASVFLRHEWFDAAWQWLATGDCRMRILCVYEQQQLVGICPLVSRDETVRGFRVRVLEFMQVPDTQYCDILAAPERRRDVMTALLKYLVSAEQKWDRLELARLGENANARQAGADAARSLSLRFSLDEYDANPGIRLEQGWKTFYSHRSRRLKKGNNHVLNRIRKAGKQIELERLGAGEELSTVLDSATRLSANSWKKRTQLTLDNPGPSAFFRRLTEHAQRNGWLSYWLLKFDGVPVAMEYQLAYDGVVSALRADYDMAFDELSPGTYMNWKMLEQLFEAGERLYCMGPGGNTYKRRWAEEFPPQFRLTLYNRNLRGRLLGFLDLDLKPGLKALIGRIRGGEKDDG